MARNPVRGIAPERLLDQVRSTAPYVFEPSMGAEDILATEVSSILREHDCREPLELSRFEYFRLCVAAHLATCATPVPTDVDNTIRRNLWGEGLSTEDALAMAEFVLEVRRWNVLPLTSRASRGADASPWSEAWIHGHRGEWFTIAAAAYAALGRFRTVRARSLREALFAAISEESEVQSEVFASLWRAKDGLGALSASVSIAHNFGDLDRVIDMWGLAITDPLRRHFYKLASAPFGQEKELRFRGRLWVAGELYKAPIEGSSMAKENHRHFALRRPRALRSDPALRVPIGPFFDDWGRKVAERLETEALGEVVDALASGIERLGVAVGYVRALRAIGEAAPETTARWRALRKKPSVRRALEGTEEEFRARWASAALEHLEQIPSRAR